MACAKESVRCKSDRRNILYEYTLRGATCHSAMFEFEHDVLQFEPTDSHSCWWIERYQCSLHQTTRACLYVAKLTLLIAPSNVLFLLMASVTAVAHLHVLSLSSMLTLHKRVVALTGILLHQMMVLTSLLLHMTVVLPRLTLDRMLVLDGLLLDRFLRLDGMLLNKASPEASNEPGEGAIDLVPSAVDSTPVVSVSEQEAYQPGEGGTNLLPLS
jgi:hypothetical protein